MPFLFLPLDVINNIRRGHSIGCKTLSPERGETTVYYHPGAGPLPSALGHEDPPARASIICRASSPPSTSLDDQDSLARVLEWFINHSTSPIKHRLDCHGSILCRCRTSSFCQCFCLDLRQQYWHNPNDAAPCLSLRSAYPLHYGFRLSGFSSYSISLEVSFSVSFWFRSSLFRVRFTPGWDGPAR